MITTLASTKSNSKLVVLEDGRVTMHRPRDGSMFMADPSDGWPSSGSESSDGSVDDDEAEQENDEQGYPDPPTQEGPVNPPMKIGQLGALSPLRERP